MSVQSTEDTNGESVPSILAVKTGEAAVVEPVEASVAGFKAEEVAECSRAHPIKDVVRSEVAAMEVVSRLDATRTMEAVVAIMHEENSSIITDRNERNSREIVMVGRNLITTIMGLAKVTGIVD